MKKPPMTGAVKQYLNAVDKRYCKTNRPDIHTIRAAIPPAEFYQHELPDMRPTNKSGWRDDAQGLRHPSHSLVGLLTGSVPATGRINAVPPRDACLPPSIPLSCSTPFNVAKIGSMSVKQAILDTRVGDLLLSIYRKFKGTSYARRRSHCKYYPAVVRFARQHAPGAETVLEVGPYDTDTLLQLDWIADRTAVDIIRKPRLPRTKNIRADFMTCHPEKKFDLVLCLQVLEHLNEPGPFAHKLLETGHVVIISVPYLWPEHACPAQVQDPVDEEKLLAWTGRPWAAHEIITEGDQYSSYQG